MEESGGGTHTSPLKLHFLCCLTASICWFLTNGPFVYPPIRECLHLEVFPEILENPAIFAWNGLERLPSEQ